MKPLSTPHAPKALGHYEQGMSHNGLIFVSGQLPINPENPEAEAGDIEAQTLQTLSNLEAVLKAAGSDRRDILKVTVYIADLALWGRMNAAYAEFFGDHKPARAAVPVPNLPKGFLLEIEAIAKEK